MTRVLVSGSRGFMDENRVHQKLDAIHLLQPITRIIHGGCLGPDMFADRWAEAREIPRTVFDADWERYGKAAGPMRNADMVKLGCADVVVAFWDGKSRGTNSLIAEATKAGLRVEVVRQD